MNKVLAFGEILWDIIENKKYLGGAPLNFAVHYAQCGGQSAILSRVGHDEDGANAIQRIGLRGVGTHMIQHDDARATGTVTVSLVNGQPSYVIHEHVAYDYIDVPKDMSAISNYKSFYFGTLAQRNEKTRQTLMAILEKSQFEQVFFDVNLRQTYFSDVVIKGSMPYCTILKLNDEEVDTISEILFGKKHSFDGFSEAVFAQYPKMQLVIVTKGAAGCTVYERGQKVDVPSEKVIVADTVGAGDSFSASFLACYSKGMDVKKAAGIANKVAGFVASNQGPTPVYTKEINYLVR